ncbi:MAG: 4-alpha-glucanotransferase [Gammaproteobacteria bacterium]|nr:MAG: 4-alpha-glucanotransferase [Gammaproteobacteria bacterium]TND07362.1 MAG: 4-alpha-glucanotransferase [Gammaproteobacteria bacterium]
MNHPLDQRRAGVILHPTSLPGRWGNGDLGGDAYRFVDFLQACGQTVWQMLPLGPTHIDGSPYQCLSVHAGNPLLISIDALIDAGWLDAPFAVANFQAHSTDRVVQKRALLARAHAGFLEKADRRDHAALALFIDTHHHWLRDYALYQALRKENRGAEWDRWPVEQRDRAAATLDEASRRLARFIHQVCFEQFVFFRQWQALKNYAHQRGIWLFGDMPIFVAYDSADVWSRREYFELDETGHMRVVAGVPPDYFSATGQRWGNPHYRWSAMAANGFRWWIERVQTQRELVDLIRIDHFRGFEAYWEIPADSPTAINGRWVTAPGEALFSALRRHFGPLPLVAEDLGLITPEVDALRKKFSLPGMKILQFAFDGGPDNPYLPHNHEINSVVYTGTHDNDTTLGWYTSLGDDLRRKVDDYLGLPGDPMPWPLIRCAYSSIAQLAMVPMQDVLMLGGEHRTNRPGTTEGNWLWRFEWEQVTDDNVARLRHLAELYERLGVTPAAAADRRKAKELPAGA